MKKRTLILTGAGAAIPWDAPTSKQITEKFCSDTTFRTLTGQPIGAWFYDKLIHFYHKTPTTVNFETILYSIETLENYYSSYLKGPSFFQYDVIIPAFFRQKEDIEELLAFDRIYSRTNTGGWESHNPRLSFWGFWDDCDHFFRSVRKLFIRIISVEIEKYENRCIDEKFAVINGYVNGIFNKHSNNVFRTYTLNYDLLLTKICDLKFFDGFSDDGKGKRVFNPSKVINDQEVHCFYNLHGNIHYDISILGVSNNPVYSHDSQSGSNLIAGLNKSLNILEKPYSHFYHSFYRDCINADEIIIVGYSFSDLHINKALIEGSSINLEQKILCVGYDKIKSEINFDNESEYDLFKLNDRKFHKFMGEHHPLYKIQTIQNRDQIFYFRKGINNFLKQKIWEKVFN